MPKYVVNLSTMITLYDARITGIRSFTGLCVDYSPSKPSCCVAPFNLFFTLYNAPWVAKQYWDNQDKFINPYKLGKLNTQSFLNEMLKMFSFLQDNRVIIPKSIVDNLWENKDLFWTLHQLQNKDSLTRTHIAHALLEQAWNSIIDLQQKDFDRFEQLINVNPNEICFVSNSNELNIFKIVALLKRYFNNNKNFQVQWNINMDLSVNANRKPIEVAKINNIPIRFYVSYNYGAFKTDSDNQQANIAIGTPNLLKIVVNDLNNSRDFINVISHYPKDREQAKQDGIPHDHIFSPQDYFQTATSRISYKV